MFYSQFGEDEFIVKNFNIPETGTFVDIGAGDGIGGNNTYWFEKNGWSGICVDCDFRVIPQLLQNRRCKVMHCCVSNRIEFRKFYLDPRTGLSKICDNGELIVLTCTINDILSFCGINNVDIFSIDIEQFDFIACSAMDFSKYRPNIIIIEHWWPESEEYSNIKKMLNDVNYEIIHETYANFIAINSFIKNELLKG